MTADQARASFLELPAQRKPLFLALLAHNLTIAARGWVPGSRADEKVAARYWTFNEIQHTVSAKLMALCHGDGKGFSDEGFLDVLFEKADTHACNQELLQAFTWANNAMR